MILWQCWNGRLVSAGQAEAHGKPMREDEEAHYSYHGDALSRSEQPSRATGTDIRGRLLCEMV